MPTAPPASRKGRAASGPDDPPDKQPRSAAGFGLGPGSYRAMVQAMQAIDVLPSDQPTEPTLRKLIRGIYKLIASQGAEVPQQPGENELRTAGQLGVALRQALKLFQGFSRLSATGRIDRTTVKELARHGLLPPPREKVELADLTMTLPEPSKAAPLAVASAPASTSTELGGTGAPVMAPQAPPRRGPKAGLGGVRRGLSNAPAAADDETS